MRWVFLLFDDNGISTLSLFWCWLYLSSQPKKSPKWICNQNRNRASSSRAIFRNQVPDRALENLRRAPLCSSQLCPHHHLPLHHPRAQETSEQGVDQPSDVFFMTTWQIECISGNVTIKKSLFQPLPDITLDSLPYHAWALDISEVNIATIWFQFFLLWPHFCLTFRIWPKQTHSFFLRRFWLCFPHWWQHSQSCCINTGTNMDFFLILFSLLKLPISSLTGHFCTKINISQVYFGETCVLDSWPALWVQSLDNDCHCATRSQSRLPLWSTGDDDDGDDYRDVISLW